MAPVSPFLLSRYDSNREAGVSMAQAGEGCKVVVHTVNKRTFGGWNREYARASGALPQGGEGRSRRPAPGRFAGQRKSFSEEESREVLDPGLGSERASGCPSAIRSSPFSLVLHAAGSGSLSFRLPVYPGSLPRSAATRFEKLMALLRGRLKATTPLSTPSTNKQDRAEIGAIRRPCTLANC